MKHARKTFQAILTILFVGVMISVSSWTFAQEGGSPGSVKSDKELLTEKTVETTKVLNWETGAGKSYLIPALEIPAFLLLLNGYDRLAYPNDMEDGKKVYDTNLSTFWDHVVHGPWGIDKDAFAMNQFAHPYQGSMYHGFARSAGLNYWESLLYTNVGSFLWETGGETTHPSINDQIRQRHWRELLRGGALPDGQPGARGRWRQTRVLARAGCNGDLTTHGDQPFCLWRPVQARISRAIIRPPSGACGSAQV